MGERACPLRMAGNNEAVSVLEKTRACIKEKCAWWFENPFKTEKGKQTKPGACAVVLLVMGGFPEGNRVVHSGQLKSREKLQKEMKALIEDIVAQRGDEP